MRAGSLDLIQFVFEADIAFLAIEADAVEAAPAAAAEVVVGIGRHLAEVILAAGDVLTAAVRKPESMSDLTERYGERLVVEKLDVTVVGDIAPVVARAQARRPVDIVVNNAGGGVIGASEAAAMPPSARNASAALV